MYNRLIYITFRVAQCRLFLRNIRISPQRPLCSLLISKILQLGIDQSRASGYQRYEKPALDFGCRALCSCAVHVYLVMHFFEYVRMVPMDRESSLCRPNSPRDPSTYHIYCEEQDGLADIAERSIV